MKPEINSSQNQPPPADSEQGPPLLRLVPLWGWLPAFRATAEQGSVSAAARVLGVAPSAVSRSLRLLEGAVATSLFERIDGRSLRLNDAGRRLFEKVRVAMRVIDDGLPTAASARPIAVPAGVTTDAWPAARCEPYVDLDVALQRLRSGAVDGVFVVGNHTDHSDGFDVEQVVVPARVYRRASTAGEH